MSSSAPLSIHVVGAKPDTTVELLPGRAYVPLTPHSMETLGLAELVPAGDGTFRPVVRICPRRFTISPKNLKRLGIAISEKGLRRLVRCGLVKGERVTPNVTQFDFFDYLRHEHEVFADPEFWGRREPGHNFTNLERYQQAL